MTDATKNPGALAGAAEALVDVHMNADIREIITFDGNWKPGSARERADDYRAEIVRLSPKRRVILCKYAHRWIVQRKDGERTSRARWTGSRYFRTRKALIAACVALCRPCDPAALARLALLPEVFG